MAKKIKTRKARKRKDLIFYCLLLAFPLLQFSVFYLGVNINSILMAFQRIDTAAGTIEWTFETLSNAFEMMTSQPDMLAMLRTSLTVYALGLVIIMPLALFFSFYIYKKMPGHGAFRILLYLPSIISALVMTVIFQFFMERAIPAIMKQFFDIKMIGLIENPDTRFGAIFFFYLLCSFGTNVLMYSNAMSAISQEISEAAQIDGASFVQEFLHITLPSIYPTIMTFLISGIASIFMNQFGLFSFFGIYAPAEIRTYGYYFFARVQTAGAQAEYSTLAAMGLLMTCVAVPLTLLVRWALEKFGPSED